CMGHGPADQRRSLRERVGGGGEQRRSSTLLFVLCRLPWVAKGQIQIGLLNIRKCWPGVPSRGRGRRGRGNCYINFLGQIIWWILAASHCERLVAGRDVVEPKQSGLGFAP